MSESRFRSWTCRRAFCLVVFRVAFKRERSLRAIEIEGRRKSTRKSSKNPDNAETRKGVRLRINSVLRERSGRKGRWRLRKSEKKEDFVAYRLQHVARKAWPRKPRWRLPDYRDRCYDLDIFRPQIGYTKSAFLSSL